ncbi:MAG TPA: peptide chain release factor N(5)-glutamine methyltransferase [Candidatus Cloacimonetes bacterium]|nr:peptide chain release factor N(5)-glutamine methyltransferase [Candidatus Cloacimonadota bacterium]
MDSQNKKKVWTVKDVLFWTSDYFTEKDIPSPHLNAELLIAHVLECSRLDLYLKYDKPLAEKNLSNIKKLIKSRAAHYPIQYLLGSTEFYGISFFVEEGVLIPRPETEILVDAVISYIKESSQNTLSLLDIGTGTGNIPISISNFFKDTENDIQIVATDISEKALKLAKKNIDALNIENISLLHSNIFDKVTGTYDYIISNPPYISENEFMELPKEIKDHEPKEALFAKEDGLEFYHKILQNAEKYLKKDGRIFFEIGAYQKEELSNLAEQYNYKIIDIKKDYNDFNRVLILKNNT